MDWLLPVVMGTTAFAYVHIFNHTMKLYRDSGYTMDWNDLLSSYKQKLG